jgi:hypothetical protein
MQLDFSSRDGGGFHVECFFGIFLTVFRAFFEAKNAPKNTSKNANVKHPNETSDSTMEDRGNAPLCTR